jgi:hypothetical protein
MGKGGDYKTKNRIVPASGKIMDITHADTNEHAIALPAGFPANTRALLIMPSRQAGTSNFRILSVTGDTVGAILLSNQQCAVWVRSASGDFLYRLMAANDDWDIYCVGYLTGSG